MVAEACGPKPAAHSACMMQTWGMKPEAGASCSFSASPTSLASRSMNAPSSKASARNVCVRQSPPPPSHPPTPNHNHASFSQGGSILRKGVGGAERGLRAHNTTGLVGMWQTPPAAHLGKVAALYNGCGDRQGHNGRGDTKAIMDQKYTSKLDKVPADVTVLGAQSDCGTISVSCRCSAAFSR